MRVFIERAMHIAILALGSLFVASINAAPNSFQREVQSESHALSGLSGFKIAVSGDSLTAARPFIDAVLDANGIRKTGPLMPKATCACMRKRQPIRWSSAGSRWRNNRSRPNSAALSGTGRRPWAVRARPRAGFPFDKSNPD